MKEAGYSRVTIWRCFEKYPDAKQDQIHDKKGSKMKPFREKLCSNCRQAIEEDEEREPEELLLT